MLNIPGMASSARVARAAQRARLSERQFAERWQKEAAHLKRLLKELRVEHGELQEESEKRRRMITSLQDENNDLLARIQKRLGEDSEITLAAKPDWTVRHSHFKKTRKKLQRIAEKEKMRLRGRDNMDLLRLIERATPYYDSKDWKESFRRHIRLKRAMRKVDDPVPKKKTADERRAALLRPLGRLLSPNPPNP